MNPVQAGKAVGGLVSASPGAPETGTSSLPSETPAREAAALLLLLQRGRLAKTRYADHVEEAGSAFAVLERERLLAAPQTSLFASPEDDLERDLAIAQRDIAAWRAQGMQLVSVLDSRYPGTLRTAHDRPALLFLAGRFKPRDLNAVAVVGSRDATRQGLRAARNVAEHLVSAGHTVTSGLATGIDTVAHTTALERGGRTIAVIGTGLSRCYPRANVILQRRIAAQCAVVSQFLPDTPPAREHFPLRNALMSGLSLATVIVEASYTSGTRIQARRALAQGRPVFLLEPLLHQKWAKQLAERPAVYVVSTPEEITATLDRIYSPAALVA
jgi:DNA processing protein